MSNQTTTIPAAPPTSPPPPVTTASTAVPTAPPAPAVTSHVETVRAIQEALGRGDIMAPMAHFSKKVRWAVACSDRDAAPFFKEYTGRPGIAAFMEAMDVVTMDAFEITDVFGVGDRVVVRLRMAFTAPTGKSVDMDELQIWTFADGKVVAVDLFPDTQAVAAAFT